MNSPKACTSPFTPRNFLARSAIAARVGIVFQTIRGCRHEAVRLKDDALWSERAHVEPHRGRARAAVERKRQRTLSGFLPIERVGDEKHFGVYFAVATLDGKPPGRRLVTESLVVQRDLVMRDDGGNFRHVVMFFLVLIFIGGFAGLGFGRLRGLAAFRGLVRRYGARRRWLLLALIFPGRDRLHALGRRVL